MQIKELQTLPVLPARFHGIPPMSAAGQPRRLSDVGHVGFTPTQDVWLRRSEPTLRANIRRHWRGSLADKHFQRIKQRLRIVLTLINGRRRGAALEQDVDRFPRRADGAFDGEGYFPGNLDVLADESEIGRPLWNRGRLIAAAPGEPGIVDVGHVARHANR